MRLYLEAQSPLGQKGELPKAGTQNEVEQIKSFYL